MAQIISASIDLNKVPREKIVTTDKDGRPFKNGASYLNVSIIVNDSSNEYGNDVSITIGQTREDRDNKVKPTYIGNGKTIWRAKEQKKNVQPQNDNWL